MRRAGDLGRRRTRPSCLRPTRWRTSRTVRVRRRAAREPLEHLAVGVAADLVGGLGQGQPAQLVDLARRREGALLRLHRPPAHDLRPHAAAAGLHVARLAQPAADPDVEAGLLEHLADGALEVGLAGRDLALRQAPIVVARPMDDRDLDPRLPVDALDPSPHDATGGADGRADHIAHFRQALASDLGPLLEEVLASTRRLATAGARRGGRPRRHSAHRRRARRASRGSVPRRRPHPGRRRAGPGASPAAHRGRAASLGRLALERSGGELGGVPRALDRDPRSMEVVDRAVGIEVVGATLEPIQAPSTSAPRASPTAASAGPAGGVTVAATRSFRSATYASPVEHRHQALAGGGALSLEGLEQRCQRRGRAIELAPHAE